MAVKKSPAFQFYPNDFLAGTRTMSLQEVGAYMRLICHQWDAGSIPQDSHARARIMVCSKAQERELWKIVGLKFELTDGVFVNRRMELERQKQAEYRQKQSNNGKASAAARFNGGSTTVATVVQPSHQPEVNSSSSSSSSSSKEQIPASKERSLPVGFDAWWSAYPKKVSKGAAIKAWTKIRPDSHLQAKMLDALRWQVRQPAWTKDSGAFIPHPATYLNAAAYLDEPFHSTTEPVRVSAIQSRHEQMLANIEAGVYRG